MQMQPVTQITPGGKILKLPELEMSEAFSITKDGIHLEVFSFEGNYSFKIFDASSTKLIKSWEVERK